MKVDLLVVLSAAATLFLALSWPVLATDPPLKPEDLRVGGFPGGQIRLSWTDKSGSETEYRIERSPNGRNNYTLLARLPANKTVYTDTAVTLDTTYWYRVRACHQAACSEPSKDSYGVSFAATALPNPDERYMLFLVNEARAAPAAYGYPAYEPRPPLVYNPLLHYAAHAHAQAVLNANFTVGHCYPTPNDPSTEYRCASERARDVGYSCGVSETMIQGGDGWQAVEAAHKAFISSLDHRELLLDLDVKEAGMGHVYDPRKGTTWHGQYTQTFCDKSSAPPQPLPAGLVVPYWGRSTTLFTFLVNFYNPQGGGPSQAQVVIDGRSYPMKLRRGEAPHGSYAYTTTLPQGSHKYYFEFKYNGGKIARLPASGVYHGPDVEVGQAVLEVPGEYATLAEALAEARGEVIIQLAAGTFRENTPLKISKSGVWLRGAGLDKTIIQGDGAGHVLEVSADTLIQDLTITGSGLKDHFESGIWHIARQLDLRRVRLTQNQAGLFTYCFSSACQAVATVKNSIFDHNHRVAVEANAFGVHHLTNVTIVSNGQGMILNNSASWIENSIVSLNSGDGLAGPDRKFSKVWHNNVWGNGLNYRDLDPGPNNLSVSPQFEDETSGDYRLQMTSPCLDAGRPAAGYDDRNGSRNDLGAYGGPAAPVTLNSRVMVSATTPGTFQVSWQGYASEGIRNYDIQYRLGYNGIWQDWLSHTNATSAQFGPTEPVTISANGVYYFRSRVRDILGNEETYPSQPDAATGIEHRRGYLPLLQK